MRAGATASTDNGFQRGWGGGWTATSIEVRPVTGFEVKATRWQGQADEVPEPLWSAVHDENIPRILVRLSIKWFDTSAMSRLIGAWTVVRQRGGLFAMYSTDERTINMFQALQMKWVRFFQSENDVLCYLLCDPSPEDLPGV